MEKYIGKYVNTQCIQINLLKVYTLVLPVSIVQHTHEHSQPIPLVALLYTFVRNICTETSLNSPKDLIA